MSFTIVSTRFNTNTISENTEWRNANNWSGCIYGVPNLIKQSIELNGNLFVLEMNNDKNKIVGIGLMKNKPHLKKCHIYSDRYYCKYVYKGNYRIDRHDMNEREKNVLRILDILVFKGATHIKRGKGISEVPKKLLERGKLDFEKLFRDMFVTHFN